MFSLTPWRIREWNGVSIGFSTSIIGILAGPLDIGLLDMGSGTRHTLGCVGLGASIGVGVGIEGMEIPWDIIPAPAYGSRVEGGFIYKNDNIVPGSLTFDHLQDGTILARSMQITPSRLHFCLVNFQSWGRFGATALSAPIPAAAEIALWFSSTAFAMIQIGSLSPSATIQGCRYRVARGRSG